MGNCPKLLCHLEHEGWPLADDRADYVIDLGDEVNAHLSSRGGLGGGERGLER